ncbi:MAG: TIGR03086 family metal-binding protein [Actinomycetota bacterium]|nr:TIGR03086 family protein [Acidimicrobiia bacterium]MDQ3470581.1 TIGR03086 family metal-binding protein [Actinomycetota bacterium]
MDLVALHEGTVREFTARVAAVPDDRWDDPTPCTDWNVRQLVNHVVGEDRWTVPLLAGRTIADVGGSLDGDLLGDDQLAATRAAADDAVASVAAQVPNNGTVQLSYGEESATEYVHQLAADHLLHAWDLAVATGGDTHLDAELVDAVAAWFADREELYRAGGVIGDRVEVSGDEPQDALLGAFGRDPAWRVS